MKNGPDDVFGEPIYTYTDEQAVEDDVLVAIAGPGRVNRVTRAISPLMDAIRAVLQAEIEDGWRIATYQDRVLWLVPNEVGGHTLMFPEDY